MALLYDIYRLQVKKRRAEKSKGACFSPSLLRFEGVYCNCGKCRKGKIMSKTERREVVAALILDNGRFMVCRRPEGKPRAGMWEFVGGKAEQGETLQEALVRECQEEIGVTVKVGEPYMDVTYDYPDIPVHLTLFHAEIAEGTPTPMEHNTIGWISPADIPNYTFCPADIPIIERLKSDFEKMDS